MESCGAQVTEFGKGPSPVYLKIITPLANVFTAAPQETWSKKIQLSQVRLHPADHGTNALFIAAGNKGIAFAFPTFPSIGILHNTIDYSLCDKGFRYSLSNFGYH